MAEIDRMVGLLVPSLGDHESLANVFRRDNDNRGLAWALNGLAQIHLNWEAYRLPRRSSRRPGACAGDRRPRLDGVRASWAGGGCVADGGSLSAESWPGSPPFLCVRVYPSDSIRYRTEPRRLAAGRKERGLQHALTHLAAVQQRVDDFVRFYNTKRPHLS